MTQGVSHEHSFRAHFHNAAAATARLEAMVRPNGPFCPRCGGFDRITLVRGGRAGVRRCGPCKREFTVTVGTIFEANHIKLHLWFQAAHLMASFYRSHPPDLIWGSGDRSF